MWSTTTDKGLTPTWQQHDTLSIQSSVVSNILLRLKLEFFWLFFAITTDLLKILTSWGDSSYCMIRADSEYTSSIQICWCKGYFDTQIQDTLQEMTKAKKVGPGRNRVSVDLTWELSGYTILYFPVWCFIHIDLSWAVICSIKSQLVFSQYWSLVNFLGGWCLLVTELFCIYVLNIYEDSRTPQLYVVNSDMYL